jgi:dihydrofolate synthase/folylpolyglutamate synthase
MMGRLPAAARDVVEAEAKAQNAPLWRLDQEIELVEEDGWTVRVPGRSISGLRPGLTGTKQPEAMALAVAACVAAGVDANDEAIRRGVSGAYAPGRFEQITALGQRWVLDGAHNGEAAQVLADTLRAELPGLRFTLLSGMVRGHDPARFYAPLAPLIDRAVAVPIDFHRAYPVAELAELASGALEMELTSSIDEAIERALRDSNPVLVTGSFYLVGEVGRRLGLPRRS